MGQDIPSSVFLLLKIGHVFTRKFDIKTHMGTVDIKVRNANTFAI